MAKKTAGQKKAAKKTTRRSSVAPPPGSSDAGVAGMSAGFGGPPGSGGSGWASTGFVTDDIPSSMPTFNIANGEEVLIRFLDFPGPDGRLTNAVRIRAYRVQVGKGWPWFTAPVGEDPLADAGLSAGWQFVSAILPRKSTNSKHSRMCGVGCKVYMGKKAVESLTETILSRLPRGRSLSEVDIIWKRRGEGTDSMHFFSFAPRTTALTPEEQSAVSDMPDIMKTIAPLPAARLRGIADRLSGGAPSSDDGLSGADSSTPFTFE